MKRAWNELIQILPTRIRSQLTEYDAEQCLEIRLRLQRPTQLVLNTAERWLSGIVKPEDLHQIVNRASQYSPWSAATISDGFITVNGGHRIGIGGECVVQQGNMTGIRKITSVCIRIARGIHGICGPLKGVQGSVLILGPPGSGKTTLLRDLIRTRSDLCGHAVAVVDERRELFPEGFEQGARTDVLYGCSKACGIEIALRCLNPDTIAVDEITGEVDCNALCRSAWCGVSLLATAHAGSLQDLQRRAAYGQLLQDKLFDSVILLNNDRTFTWERIGKIR